MLNVVNIVKQEFLNSLTVLDLNLLFNVNESGERCLADGGTRCKDQELLEGLDVVKGQLACLLGWSVHQR